MVPLRIRAGLIQGDSAPNGRCVRHICTRLSRRRGGMQPVIYFGEFVDVHLMITFVADMLCVFYWPPLSPRRYRSMP